MAQTETESSAATERTQGPSVRELSYQKRFQKVIDYIYEHLDAPLDLNRLADVACVSPYHWHRMYQAATGETLAVTIRRLRLHRAAGDLANHPDVSIEHVARRSGYNGVQSFTRAFSEAYGMPPARFRKEGSHNRYQPALSQAPDKRTHLMNEVTLKTIDDFTMIGVPHKGSYMNIGNAFEKLFGWLGMKGLISPAMRSFGIYLDDPAAVAEDQLRSAACATIEGMTDDMAATEGGIPVETFHIAGGEYAILRHKGPYSDMQSAYQWLYGEWLTSSGREVADQPCFEEYVNNPREVPPAELLTDIYMPLKPAV